MTPEMFIDELEQIFDKHLKPKQAPLYLDKLRRFTPEQRLELLNRVLEEAKYFPKVSEIFKAAQELGFLSIDLTVTRFHRWRDTDCSMCFGEGRIATIWQCTYQDRPTGRVEIQAFSKVMPYSRCFDYVTQEREFRAVFRCKCLAGDVSTLPKGWPKWTKSTPAVREVWL